MSNRVNRKIDNKKPNLNWQEFIDGLRVRLNFHEHKANGLRSLIPELERLKNEGMELPAAQKKAAETEKRDSVSA
jgi:hypothetical protein